MEHTNNASVALASLLESMLLQSGFKGEFHVDYSTRLINASDNSIYEVLPAGVAQPYDGSDLQLLLKFANQEPFKKLHFCARGGGTGTNGQSLSDGVVIDFSRFMTRVLSFDPQQQTVTVEPGMILSDLNRFLHAHGLFYAPNVSTADRATIGGMIATDAAGKGSLIYGKTADHLLGVHFILADGQVLNTLSGKADLESAPLFGQLAQQIGGLLEPLQAEIELRFPPLKRPLSGYNIRQCYQNGNFDLNYLVAGSEGTLGLLAAAKLRLLPIPRFKNLLVVHYASFVAALEDAQFLIQFHPLAIEAIDEKVQKSAQTLPNWPQLAKWLNCEEQSYISNFIEFVAESAEELEQKIQPVIEALNKRQANFVRIVDNNQINQLWTIRSLAVGLAGKMPGVAKPVAFVEDGIVPPEHLASFVVELRAELDRQQLNYAMYGHVDVGCIHVRPALDMLQASEREKIRPITEMVIKLLTKYQGILWGEHGKGYRGEFVPDVFGPLLYPALCQIKKLFDPHNRLNPGKLTSPNAGPLTRIEQVPMRGQFDQPINAVDQQNFSAALLCNGNAACFNQEPSNVMCPSYKVTKDRVHSPKGRAMLVKEWLREKAKPPELSRQRQVAELAYAALSGCLGCKGCAGKCPTQVSIPDLRSKFLAEYHERYKKRSLRDLALGHIEAILPWAAKFPRLWNFVQHPRLLAKFGLVQVPKFNSQQSFSKLLKRLNVAEYSDPRQIAKFAPSTLVIFADVFSGLLEQKVLVAAISVLKKVGYTIQVIAPRVSGKALIVGGFIRQFQQNSQQLAELLNPLLLAKIPVIGLENTITLMLRDEVAKFGTPLVGRVLTLAELLTQVTARFAGRKVSAETLSYRLLPHCTEQAVLPSEALNWQTIFASLGAKLEIKNLGCCGMAGTYGHLQEQQENSANLFAAHWAASVSSEQVLATGFSCRSQVENQAQKTIRHPIELLNQLLA